MESTLKYEVHPKEKFYFAIKVIAALFGYVLIIYEINLLLKSETPEIATIILIYTAVIIFYLFCRIGIMIGYIKGNGVKITAQQFPDIYKIVEKQSAQLGLTRIPDVYLLQSGGLLNAFATGFLGSKYVVIYSDVLEEAYESNLESVEFIVGHELGHIKRNHMTKNLLLFPAFFVPFLSVAYSRGCEYTCDNIGGALNSKGAHQGLLLLASGKKLWRKIKYDSFVQQEQTEKGFWFWFAEKCSTHPRLTKRLERFPEVKPTFNKPSLFEINQNVVNEIKQTASVENAPDNNIYMPK
jgi:Zn-dependent protease with chaperone function